MRPRRTARVFVFDPLGRVLLIHFSVARSTGPFMFWLMPGGEIEPGETPLDAAVRELQEEVSLATPVSGPIYTEQNQFEHQHEMRDNTDYFFVTHCAPDAPHLTGLTPEEIAIMQRIRWWSAREISAALTAGVNFFPVDIVNRMEQLAPEARTAKQTSTLQ